MIHVFILNPEVGKPGFGKNLRKKLEMIPNLTYYVFDTRFQGEERELTTRIVNLFEDEDIRLYCCGGSGTFRNVIDALNEIKQIEVTFIPIGMTNDFLKCFHSDAEKFKDVENLIDGDVVYLDYVASNYGCSINAVSLGLDGNVISLINKEREKNVLTGPKPYFITMLRSLIHIKNRKFVVEIDGVSMTCGIAELILGNGFMLGGFLHFAKNPLLQEGKVNYTIVSTNSFAKLCLIIYQSVKGRVDYVYNNAFHGKCVNMSIRAEDEKSFFVSFDGELIEVKDTLSLCIKPKALKFVVPKGVELP